MILLYDIYILMVSSTVILLSSEGIFINSCNFQLMDGYTERKKFTKCLHPQTLRLYVHVVYDAGKVIATNITNNNNTIQYNSYFS